ncbi:trigger factor [Ruminiclostridium cellulolyticum]|uniref:Trigger factor n=1 Tax=Ruminiclostridium cellulolyticum (strain ATCC 35319 / DSM 5812 / JCM 6584 / H10) TaxID=394503 RepID=TIG_RUMCH|nr:trigger factor [Ruminiclostridium cellulolyticum]B8I8F4.1 RecName: Full=Trigger factor; Short=TF; AltName: Full=PPIase [Ruminiclostridium cellulolyticum H10]ACL75187.1 trigger factor [Ruminiclostridium cellulolyticum H10]
MKVKVENVEKNVVQLEIEVDTAKFEEGMQQSYLKNVKKFNVPGFRKGKAPRNIIERYYGEQALYDDAINIVCSEAYDNAIEENNINPVDRPEIDIVQIGKNQNLIFTAKVTVKPEVELGAYMGVEAKKAEANVTDEDLENEFNKVVEKNARLVSVTDRPIQSGDTAVIDFEGFIDSVPFEGGKGEDYSLVIGSGTFIPGFEDQLIGKNIADDVDVNVSFPEEYGKEELNGKEALFKVLIKEIKVKELPTVDDEFAKDISEFDTLEEYKNDLRNKLEESAKSKAERDNEESVIQAVVGNATVDIPNVMVEKHIDAMARDFDMRLRYQGLDLQRYLEIMGTDFEGFREQFRERAANEVKIQLVIEKISKVENVEATDADVEEEITKTAEAYKQPVEELKKTLRPEDLEYVKNDIAFRKTIKILVDNAKLN